MPTSYQRDSLQAMLGLFLEAQGHPLPQHSQTKSPSALSRFLNQYDWGTRQIIRAVRKAILKELLNLCSKRKTTLVAGDCGLNDTGEMRKI